MRARGGVRDGVQRERRGSERTRECEAAPRGGAVLDDSGEPGQRRVGRPLLCGLGALSGRASRAGSESSAGGRTPWPWASIGHRPPWGTRSKRGRGARRRRSTKRVTRAPVIHRAGRCERRTLRDGAPRDWRSAMATARALQDREAGSYGGAARTARTSSRTSAATRSRASSFTGSSEILWSRTAGSTKPHLTATRQK